MIPFPQNTRHRYALAGVALFAPIAAFYWLDAIRKRKASRGAGVTTAAASACAALAAPERSDAALAAGVTAAATPLAGGALALLTERMERAGLPGVPAPDGRDAQALLWIGAGASAAACLLMAYGARDLKVVYTPHSGRPGDYRWISLNPSTTGRLLAWAGYSAHQLGLWACIYIAQRQRLAYGAALRPVNWTALGVNAGGVLLHYLHTKRYYDGLAADVPEGSALGSVAFMLMLTLVLETPRRGLAFGTRRVNLPKELIQLVRRYHGYIFSWAVVYTFWYHPMEPRSGHVLGFFHTMLLLIQASLPFTRAHLNKRWTAALEMMVLPHSVTTAIMNRNRLAPMFAFGFTGMALIAQMHGLGLSRRVKLGAYLAYGAALLGYYGRRGELHQAVNVLRVPALEYGVVGVLAAITLLWRVAARRPNPVVIREG
jgi:hypothetical protein